MVVKTGPSLFCLVGRTPEELPFALLFIKRTQTCLLSPGALPYFAHSNLISTEWNHSWFRSTDLTMCLEGRQNTQKKKKKNLVERRGIQKQQQCLGCLIWQTVQPGEASKNSLRDRAIPPPAQIMSPYAGKRNLTHFDIIQETPPRYHFKGKLPGWKYPRRSS